MGISDPSPAGYMIWFGSLEFRATGNGYLMELLSPRRNPDTPTSPARRNRRSGQNSRQARMERRRAAHLSFPSWVEADVSQPGVEANGVTTSSPLPSAAPEPPKDSATAASPFPLGMRNVAATYASSGSTNMSAYEDLPGHHLILIRNLTASTPDDS